MNKDEIKDYIEKDYFLRNHHKFINRSRHKITILVDPHLVCKETNRVEVDDSLNDSLQYWVEVLLPYEIDWSIESSKFHYKEGETHCLMHDSDLDCSGNTYEEAILNAYDLMIAKYGDTSNKLIMEIYN